MKVYLVGGAVRDQLLGLPVKDRDWIVVGTDPATLLSLGYQQVGKDFPVFLNPKTKEEYALARTERKSSAGYTGFICNFSPTITLEQDLIRRDLTINAMAQSEDGEIIDPYGGKQDLENRILRHISPAFSEDPLRVLRVARFAARYHSLGFKIASETLALMTELALSGELQHLTTERIWLETEKALNEKNPEIYFETLHKTGALSVLFSEIDALHGVPNPVKHHPEVDSFIHTMLVLKQAVNLTENNPILNKSEVRFAAICHDLGKALTPQNILPHHYGHEQAGIKPTRSLCKRLKVPSYFQELAELTCEFHTHIHKAFELRAETVITLFNRFDVWRKPQRFQEFLQVCLADTRGRTGFETKDYPQIDYINQLLHTANEVDVQQVIADGFEKQAIKNELTKRRILAVKQTKTNYPTN
ncbi:tRNA nucleotidyltransferase [Haemophilus influenzae CGSHiCZ412602]|uniref:multifunctional CCA addition/repair protein n=1 Tax=Haemophilus influenzae TaxID=727 RepID=UPI00049A11AF|nr:multifunctional CCA addition/repair protein [Haemophilus influenzae]AIB46011.1 tRNA nucleotidyltransferase [Haemophilus influenzae CGSHiCZ412602]